MYGSYSSQRAATTTLGDGKEDDKRAEAGENSKQHPRVRGDKSQQRQVLANLMHKVFLHLSHQVSTTRTRPKRQFLLI
jgi:hypothetical protein